MMEKSEFTVKIEREIICDTFVLGGGLAGCSAAISSARGGCKTVLAEAEGTLGGQAGIGLVTPLSSVNDAKGVRFGGILNELVSLVGEYTEKYAFGGGAFTHCKTSPHITKYILMKSVTESGASLLFHTVLVGAECSDGRVKSVVLHDKSGFLRVMAKYFIDASGDADLVVSAGDSYVCGSEPNVYAQLSECGLDEIHESHEKIGRIDGSHAMQPVSLFFIMGGVDFEKVYCFNNRELHFGDLGITKERFMAWKYAGSEGFEITSDKIPTPQGRILVSHGRNAGEAVINMSRIIGIDGSSASSLTDGEIRAELQIIPIVDFLKTFIPGFEKSYLTETSSRLGVRESRRLVGKYVLSGTDVIKCSKFADTVCRGYYIIDIHDPFGRRKAIGGKISGDYYEIPFGSLCSAKYANLLACGRCVSCDHVAASAVRIQGTCILTGQAVGTACSVANAYGGDPCLADTSCLRERLAQDGVTL